MKERPVEGGTELFWDGGETASWQASGIYTPFATTFVAPADCRLKGFRIFWQGGSEVDIEFRLYKNNVELDSPTPVGKPIFSVVKNSGDANNEWMYINLSDENIKLEGGQVFHPACSYPEGPYGLGMEPPTYGSYSCWYTNDGGWKDSSQNYTYMFRVVVDILDE
ncbi:MAG: hypothetical protein GY771_00205 [bacterium]|nr:hypothetical protein [bacterium]